MKKFGSQIRDSLSEANYLVEKELPDNHVVLKDTTSNKLELWVLNDTYAGYVIEINNLGYEFVSSY